MVIIALHYHCYDLFVCFFFMLKLLQYCNYIIIVMQIKLMLLLLLLLVGRYRDFLSAVVTTSRGMLV